MVNLRELIKLMRPAQWLKNSFVFAGFLFGRDQRNPLLLANISVVFLAFCLISSAIYSLNDIYDKKLDQLHPNKKNRPLATGQVSILQAFLLATLLCLTSLMLGYSISWNVFILLLIYSSINIFYTLYLKKVVIIDVFCISAGFMLRLLSGTLGVGIYPSKWLLLCGLSLTLFLGFGKRRAELLDKSPDRREVLKNYTPPILDNLLSICATSTIISYSLYTMSSETIALHHTDTLIYTVPFVIYALFRYIYLLHVKGRGENPSLDLVKDIHIILSVAGWACLTFLLIKGFSFYL